MKNDSAYIKHIQEAIGKIEDYVKNLDFDSFLKDNKTIDAVIREFEIIGEAAKNLSGDFMKILISTKFNKRSACVQY